MNFWFEYKAAFDTSAWCITHSQFSFGISRQMSSNVVKELFSKTLSIITTQWGDLNVKMSLSVAHIQQKNTNFKMININNPLD